MKILSKLLLTLAAAVAVICVANGTVFAADSNYYELNFYDKANWGDLSGTDVDAYYWIFDNHGHYTWNDEEEAEYDYLSDGTFIAKIYCTEDCSANEMFLIEINDALTVDNNTTFVFTDEEKADLAQDYPNIDGYDGIIFNVVSPDEPAEPVSLDCEEVCITGVRFVSATDDAGQKAEPSYDGLDINLSMFFFGLEQTMQYEVSVANGTDEDLRISFTGLDDEYIGYDVETDDDTLRAGTEKVFLVKIYLKKAVPNELLDDDRTLLSTLKINLGVVTNPNTWDEPLPIATVAAGVIAPVILASKCKRRTKIVAVVALFGLALLPGGKTFAETKYQININSRIEAKEFVAITFMPNGEGVSGEVVTQYVKPGVEFMFMQGQFERPTYQQIWWNTKPDGSGDAYWNYQGHDYVPYSLDHDITLYAIWDKLIYFGIADGIDLTVSDKPFGDYDWNEPYGDHGIISYTDLEKFHDKSPFANARLCSSDTRADNIVNVRVVGYLAPRDLSYFFNAVGCDDTTRQGKYRMDLSGLDTSNATTTAFMLSGVGSRGHNSASNTRYTDWSIGDLSGWNVSNVTNMDTMFSGAGADTANWSIGDLSGWNVSNVTNMSAMFGSAGMSSTTWTVGDLGHWNTGKVTDMSNMFQYTGYRATSIDLGNIKRWDVSKVEDMSWMFSFYGHENLQQCTIDLNGWNTASLTNMNDMFYETCLNASSFNVDLSTIDFSQVTAMEYMFFYAARNASNWNVVIPATNGNGLANTSTRLYGADETVYAEPPAGKSFTVAE